MSSEQRTSRKSAGERVALGTVDLLSVLRSTFGYDRFRPGQREVVDYLLAGKSSAAVFPTGGGKSLCYQLPALLLPGVTIVVSPLIALMKDQIDVLSRRAIPAARLDSTLDFAQTESVYDRLRKGALRLLYVAPERFKNERFRAALEHVSVSLLAIDEAHCISEWGHSFRPDYLRIAQFAVACRADRRLALTATATPDVLQDICVRLGVDPECTVRAPFYRPNLTLIATPVTENERSGRLVERLRDRPRGPTIVYVTRQRTAEAVAEDLTQAGFKARAYHAGLEDNERSNVQDWFMESQDAIVVGTIAFGMGIDKPNIRYVYHYNLAKSMENYAQEIGRGGRDSNPSICEAFVCAADLDTLESFVFANTPAPEAVYELMDYLFAKRARPDACQTDDDRVDIAPWELSVEFDMQPLTIDTILTYLELDGYLTGVGSYYAQFAFMPLVHSAQILANFTGERRQFVEGLLRCSEKALKWFRIDTVNAARRLNADRSRIVRAMEYLADNRWLTLKPTGVRLQYVIREQPATHADLATEYNQRFADREALDLERLRKLFDLLRLSACRVSGLGTYFGEPLEHACGHCDVCRPDLRATAASGSVWEPEGGPVQRSEPGINDRHWQSLLRVRAQHPRTLGPPRAFARWACGISSPRLRHKRLQKHELFGCLQHVPFEKVLARVAGASH